MQTFVVLLVILFNPQGDAVALKAAPVASYSECELFARQLKSETEADSPGYRLDYACIPSDKLDE